MFSEVTKDDILYKCTAVGVFILFLGYCDNMHQAGNEVMLVNANDLPQTTAPYSCKLFMKVTPTAL